MTVLLICAGIFLVMESAFQRHAGYGGPACAAAMLGWVLIVLAAIPMIAGASCDACMETLFRPGSRLP